MQSMKQKIKARLESDGFNIENFELKYDELIYIFNCKYGCDGEELENNDTFKVINEDLNNIYNYFTINWNAE